MSETSRQDQPRVPELLRNGVAIHLVEGDITAMEADMMLAPIDSEGAWDGGINRAIRAAYGRGFHECLALEAQVKGDWKDGDVKIVPSVFAASEVTKVDPNGSPTEFEAITPFWAICFMFDDLQRPVADVIRSGLEAADGDWHGVDTVTVPLLRTGAMAGRYESPTDAVLGLATGIRDFIDAGPQNIRNIVVVSLSGQPRQLDDQMRFALEQ